MGRRWTYAGWARGWALAAMVAALVLAVVAVPRWDAAGAQEAGATATPPAGGGLDGEMSPVEVVQRVAPAVVTVINRQQFGGPGEGGLAPAGSGTGFIIDDEGHIVTNNHVVAGGDAFEVILADGDEREAELIGADPVSDLAVVRIEGDLPATVPLGDSDALLPGQSVLAIGSPLGISFSNTVTEGIVSATGRDFPQAGNDPCTGIYTNLIQHDAVINPGNSGGPLFDLRGQVVGVNTLGIPVSETGVPVQGLFFAVPSNTVRDIATRLIEEGEVVYPLFGIRGVAVNEQIAAQLDLAVDDGQYVDGVSEDGGAAEAGIREGDVIVAIDGQRVDRQNSFVEILFEHRPGETVEATVQRGDEELTVDVTLGERPPIDPETCGVAP